jgi:hypothetical protein
MKIAIAVSLVLAAIACAHPPRRGEALVEAVRTYHEGIRWQRFPVAATRVPSAQRDDFVEERDKLAEDLQINDYEVVRVTQRDDKRAEVQVKYTWYLDSEGTVRKTHAVEGWERHGKIGLLVDERRLRGDVMPGLAERVPGTDGRDAGADPAAGPTEARDDEATALPGAARGSGS